MCDNRNETTQDSKICEYERIIGTEYSASALGHMAISEAVEVAIKVIIRLMALWTYEHQPIE